MQILSSFCLNGDQILFLLPDDISHAQYGKKILRKILKITLMADDHVFRIESVAFNRRKWIFIVFFECRQLRGRKVKQT